MSEDYDLSFDKGTSAPGDEDKTMVSGSSTYDFNLEAETPAASGASAPEYSMDDLISTSPMPAAVENVISDTPQPASPTPAQPSFAPALEEPVVMPPEEGGKSKKPLYIGIAVIVVLLVCCCCGIIVIGAFVLSGSGNSDTSSLFEAGRPFMALLV